MFDTTLNVIDLQRDYLAVVLIALFRANSTPVVHVRHFEKSPAVGFLLEGTPGAEIDPRVAPQGDEMLITKNYPNAFRDTTLAKILHVPGAKEFFLRRDEQYVYQCHGPGGVRPQDLL